MNLLVQLKGKDNISFPMSRSVFYLINAKENKREYFVNIINPGNRKTNRISLVNARC